MRMHGVWCRLGHEQRAQEEPVPWQFGDPRLTILVEAAEPQARLLQRPTVAGVEPEGAVERLDGLGGRVAASPLTTLAGNVDTRHPGHSHGRQQGG
jgi:hypothetical protein